MMSFQFWFSLGSQQSPLLVTVKHSSSSLLLQLFASNSADPPSLPFLPFHQSSILVRVFAWREPGMGVLVPLFLYVVAFFCTVAAIALAVLHIYRHLLNYTEPTYQRFIVRIVFMVPVSYFFISPQPPYQFIHLMVSTRVSSHCHDLVAFRNWTNRFTSYKNLWTSPLEILGQKC